MRQWGFAGWQMGEVQDCQVQDQLRCELGGLKNLFARFNGRMMMSLLFNFFAILSPTPINLKFGLCYRKAVDDLYLIKSLQDCKQ